MARLRLQQEIRAPLTDADSSQAPGRNSANPRPPSPAQELLEPPGPGPPGPGCPAPSFGSRNQIAHPTTLLSPGICARAVLLSLFQGKKSIVADTSGNRFNLISTINTRSLMIERGREIATKPLNKIRVSPRGKGSRSVWGPQGLGSSLRQSNFVSSSIPNAGQKEAVRKATTECPFGEREQSQREKERETAQRKKRPTRLYRREKKNFLGGPHQMPSVPFTKRGPNLPPSGRDSHGRVLLPRGPAGPKLKPSERRVWLNHLKPRPCPLFASRKRKRNPPPFLFFFLFSRGKLRGN